MNILLKIFFFCTLTVLVLSCENDLTAIKISGEIENYDPAAFDSIICLNYKLDTNYLRITAYHSMSKCSISKNGTFNATCTEPLYTYPITERIKTPTEISDTTVKIAYMRLQAYKNGKISGFLEKCNEAYMSNPMGNNHALYMYANKDVTVNGSVRPDQNTTITHRLSLKKGWNEIVYTYNYIYNPANIIEALTLNLEVTNTTTENLRWRYIK